jgi:hypothetical protein
VIFSLTGLLVKALKSKLDRELAKRTLIGGTVVIRGVAHEIKIDGHEYEADVVLRRTA